MSFELLSGQSNTPIDTESDSYNSRYVNPNGRLPFKVCHSRIGRANVPARCAKPKHWFYIERANGGYLSILRLVGIVPLLLNHHFPSLSVVSYLSEIDDPILRPVSIRLKSFAHCLGTPVAPVHFSVSPTGRLKPMLCVLAYQLQQVFMLN